MHSRRYCVDEWCLPPTRKEGNLIEVEPPRRHRPQRFVSKSGHASAHFRIAQTCIPHFRRFITDDGAVYGTIHGLTIAQEFRAPLRCGTPPAKRLMTTRLSDWLESPRKRPQRPHAFFSMVLFVTVVRAHRQAIDDTVRNSMRLTPDAFN